MQPLNPNSVPQGGKGGVGGQVANPMPGRVTGPTMDQQVGGQSMAPQGVLSPQGDFNVNDAAAAGLQQGMLGTQSAMAGPNIGQFQNPYQEQVTNNTMNDLERQRQMQMNNIGASASAAGAFGGSRHGVAEALTNEGFAQQGANAFGQLNHQGFNTALGAAQNQQGMQMAGSAQMANMGNQAFNTSQAITNQQSQQGLQAQAMQQQLIDAARGGFSQYTNSPTNALNTNLQALGASQTGQQTQTQSSSPGLFDYLSIGAGLFASDPRLKENVVSIGVIKGIPFYEWDWNERGLEVASPSQPTTGVMADELQAIYPDLVTRGDDGYLRVDYAALGGVLSEG